MPLTEIELADAQYNSRDCLAMCRAMPHLFAEIQRVGVEAVYGYDELMADLALQMTRIGMPVNTQRRAEIGERLYALRDRAIAELTPFTEGEYHEPFLDWVATFFAKTVRNGEPKDGTIRLGPTRAAAELEEAQRARAQWKAFKKTPPPPPDPENLQESADWDQALAHADEQIAAWELNVKAAKQALKVAQFTTDDEEGLAHTKETSFAVRCAIRRGEAELAISKKGVNFGAKVQQAAILRAAGVPLHRTTEKTGLPKIDKEVLEQYSRHTAARALLSYILVQKTIDTYIEGEKRLGRKGNTKPVVVGEDGYLHPLWGVHRITGRWNSSPNCQNWSKRAGGGAENLRSMIEAPDGYILVGADQKQLEARLIGAMAGCKLMIDCFRRGDDIHSLFAGIGFPTEWPRLAAIFKEHKKTAGGKCKCAECELRNKTRDRTKNLEYGAFYGGQEQKLFEAIVKDFPEATLGQVREFLLRFNAMLPEVLLWRKNVLDTAIREGEIRSPILGRRQVFPLGRVDPNVAYNYKAQSGGADIWAIGAGKFMEKWNQWEFDARLIHNGHDSVLILCREELAAEVEQDVYACWNLEWNDVPFEMECKTAKQWSET
jgi:DNA polymerase I-like protein with 3'-5' exonuclease and polymerase domains